MKILSKILVFSFFLLSIFYFLSPITPTYAASKTISAQSDDAFPSSNTKSNVPNTLHNWTQTVMIEVMSALTCQIAGVDPINPKQSCLGTDQKTGKIGFLPKTGLPAGASAQAGGAIGFMGNMITVLYTPPLHTADYFRNLAQNFGITKKTYAQQTGTGFQSLTPLIGIWSAFRNIVYLFLVIVFVVIGLAIMLRIKIDPRTVMTIQNQIPKIIIGILAVTFSFAIAGFLIDMMWVFIDLIYNVISGIPDVFISGLNPAAIQGQTAMGASNHITTGGIFGIAGNVASGTGETIANMFISKEVIAGAGSVGAIFGAIFGTVLIPIPVVGQIVGWILGGILGPTALTAAATILGSIVVLIIVVIALLVALFRLWFTLLMAYVQILLAVVLAPFWIIGGIIPGSPISFTGWLKDIGANLLAFPVTLAMFMLGKVFMDAFRSTPGFAPPLIGNSLKDSNLIGSLIGLGIILMTPNVVNMLKAALKAPKMETGIGKAIGVGAAVPMSAGKTVGAYFAKTPEIGKKGGIWGAIRHAGRF